MSLPLRASLSVPASAWAQFPQSLHGSVPLPSCRSPSGGRTPREEEEEGEKEARGAQIRADPGAGQHLQHRPSRCRVNSPIFSALLQKGTQNPWRGKDPRGFRRGFGVREPQCLISAWLRAGVCPGKATRGPRDAGAAGEAAGRALIRLAKHLLCHFRGGRCRSCDLLQQRHGQRQPQRLQRVRASRDSSCPAGRAGAMPQLSQHPWGHPAGASPQLRPWWPRKEEKEGMTRQQSPRMAPGSSSRCIPRSLPFPARHGPARVGNHLNRVGRGPGSNSSGDSAMTAPRCPASLCPPDSPVTPRTALRPPG